MKMRTFFITTALLSASLGSVATAADPKIDLVKYDIVNIYKNISDETMKSRIHDDDFQLGDNPHKILKDINFSCESLGFSKSDPGFKKQDYPDHSERFYTKKQEGHEDSVCNESIYKKSGFNSFGTNAFAYIVDGND